MHCNAFAAHVNPSHSRSSASLCVTVATQSGSLPSLCRAPPSRALPSLIKTLRGIAAAVLSAALQFLRTALLSFADPSHGIALPRRRIARLCPARLCRSPACPCKSMPLPSLSLHCLRSASHCPCCAVLFHAAPWLLPSFPCTASAFHGDSIQCLRLSPLVSAMPLRFLPLLCPCRSRLPIAMLRLR